MEGPACGDDRIVTAIDQAEQRGFERHTAVTRAIDKVAGVAQQAPHVGSPGFVFDLDQRFEFAQMVRVAQRVQHAGERIVRLPVIVHNDAGETLKHAAAGGDAIAGQQLRAGDVQPLGRNVSMTMRHPAAQDSPHT